MKVFLIVMLVINCLGFILAVFTKDLNHGLLTGAGICCCALLLQRQKNEAI